jgi:NTE family protein
MNSSSVSLFAGLSKDELEAVLASAGRLRFRSGDVLLAEGDSPRGIYVLEEGSVDVVISDPGGREHLLDRLGPGSPVGEISVLTGQPVTATVRAAEDLSVVLLEGGVLQELGRRYPRLLENIAAILSDRLAKSDRRFVGRELGRVTALRAHGAPPALGFALASSAAWHERRPVAYVSFDRSASPIVPGAAVDARAHALVFPSPEELVYALPELRLRFADIFVECGGGVPGLEPDATVVLAWEHEAVDAGLAGLVLRAVASLRTGAAGEFAVPPLEPSDLGAIATGLLPLSSPAGRALGALARRILGLRVGVALGGGAVRGWAHFGVLRVLGERSIPVDVFAGTSSGAVVAAELAAGMAPAEAEERLDLVSGRLFRPRLSRTALLSGSAMARALKDLFDERTLIEELEVPLGVTATDLLSQRHIVLTTGVLWEALRASTAIPGVFPPHRMGPYLFVDGGVLNPVPTDVVADLGADIVIGVKLTRTGRVEHSTSAMPGMIDALTATFNLMQGKIATDTAAHAGVVIEPNFDYTAGFGIRKFREGRRFVETGYAAAEAALPRLAAVLPWLSPYPQENAAAKSLRSSVL